MASDDQNKTISRIIDLRESHDWSQKDLADRMNMNKVTMNKIENGNRAISNEELKKFAQLFDVTTDYLLGANRTPKWATQKDVVDLQQMLDDPNYMDQGFAFGGGSLTDSEKEKMRLAITQVFWDRIHDKKIAKKQGDSNAEETN